MCPSKIGRSHVPRKCKSLSISTCAPVHSIRAPGLVCAATSNVRFRINAEEAAADYIKKHVKKPVVGFIAGVTAPPGKRMGHAGALISGGADTAEAKLEIMDACGIKVTRNPSEMARLLKSVLG